MIDLNRGFDRISQYRGARPPGPPATKLIGVSSYQHIPYRLQQPLEINNKIPLPLAWQHWPGPYQCNNDVHHF